MIGAIVWIVGSAVAFAVLDPIIAAFVCILGLTAVGIAFLSSDWVRSTSFEEREAERVRRRKEKWDAGAEARERDRARWEAHQARQCGAARAGRRLIRSTGRGGSPTVRRHVELHAHALILRTP